MPSPIVTQTRYRLENYHIAKTPTPTPNVHSLMMFSKFKAVVDDTWSQNWDVAYKVKEIHRMNTSGDGVLYADDGTSRPDSFIYVTDMGVVKLGFNGSDITKG